MHVPQHLETWIQTQAQVTNASGCNCLYLALISKLTEELTQPLGRAWGKAEVSPAEDTGETWELSWGERRTCLYLRRWTQRCPLLAFIRAGKGTQAHFPSTGGLINKLQFIHAGEWMAGLHEVCSYNKDKFRWHSIEPKKWSTIYLYF